MEDPRKIEANFENIQKAREIKEKIQKGEVEGGINITANQREQSLTAAMAHVKGKFANEARGVPMKQRREMIKATKTIREGHSCLIIRAKKINKSTIPPYTMESFLEEKIGGKPETLDGTELEYGDWANANLIIKYDPNSRGNKNHIASKLMDKPIKGTMVIYSEFVELEPKYLQEIMKDF